MLHIQQLQLHAWNNSYRIVMHLSSVELCSGLVTMECLFFGKLFSQPLRRAPQKIHPLVWNCWHRIPQPIGKDHLSISIGKEHISNLLCILADNFVIDEHSQSINEHVVITISKDLISHQVYNK